MNKYEVFNNFMEELEKLRQFRFSDKKLNDVILWRYIIELENKLKQSSSKEEKGEE